VRVRFGEKMAATRQLCTLRRCARLVPSRGYAAAVAAPVKAPIKVFGVEGRYAHALFSAASQKNAIEAVEKELTDFQRLADEKRELVDFIENPVLSKDRKLSALTDILKSRKASDLTINLFGALTENNRLSRAMGVIKAYCTIMSAYRGEVPCTVTSAKVSRYIPSSLPPGLLYSGTSNKGPSEIGTTSLQRTLVSTSC
jgi:hypothetical protein